MSDGASESSTTNGAALSADRLAERLGDSLPAADDIPPAAVELVDEVRELADAVLMTAVGERERAAVAVELRTLRRRLEAAVRPERTIIVRHADGRIENVTQAGSGLLNPLAPRLRFVDLPPDPVPGSEPTAVEVHATCTLGAAFGGPPSGSHGGVVASMLDQTLGVAARAAGASGMTVALHVNYRRPTPLGVPLHLAARYTESSGRTSTATGEIVVDGEVVADASAVFVREVRR